MTARPERFAWRRTILLTVGVGAAMGTMIFVLDAFYGISFPTILGGLISAVIIVVALMRSRSRR